MWRTRFFKPDPEGEVKKAYDLWRKDSSISDFEAQLSRLMRHSERALGILVHWILSGEEDKALFASAALDRIRDPKALQIIEPLLGGLDLDDDRKLMLAGLAQDLGGDVDMDEIWESLDDPLKAASRIAERAVRQAEAPSAVRAFLKNFDKCSTLNRPGVLSQLGGFLNDPRSVRLWAPLLYNHGDELEGNLSELLKSTSSALAQWWAAELVGSNPDGRFARLCAMGPIQDLAPLDAFHKAYLGAPDGAGTRTAIFSKKLASGDVFFINFSDNDQTGIQDAFGEKTTEARFQEMLRLTRARQGTLLAGVGCRRLLEAARESERRTFRRGRAFPASYLSLKEAFFCMASREIPEAEAGFAEFWSEPSGGLPTDKEVEELLRCPCLGGWEMQDPDWKKPIAQAVRRAGKKARRAGPDDERDALRFLPDFLPDEYLGVLRSRLKAYSLIHWLLGNHADARIAGRCAKTLVPAEKSRHPLLAAFAQKAVLPAIREGRQNPPLRPREPLIRLRDWVMDHRKIGAELAAEIQSRLPGGGGKAIVLDDDGQERFKLLVDWFLFDRRSKTEGRTPLESFLSSGAMAQDERAVFEGWRKNIFGVFKVLGRAMGQGVRVRRLSTGKEYEVTERLGSLQMTPGTALFARLLPLNEGHIFSGGLVSFPKEMTYSVERLFKGGQLDLDPLQVMELLRGKSKAPPLDEAVSDLPQAESDVARLLERWKVRWLTLGAVKRAIQGFPDRHKAIGSLAAEILRQADALPKGGDPTNELGRLLTVLANHIPLEDGKTPNEKMGEFSPGPQETILIHTLVTEMQRANLDPAESGRYVQRWQKTPQKELGGNSPDEAILEERKRLGNPERRIDYRFHGEQIPDPGSSALEYSRAIRLYKEGEFDEAVAIYEALRPGVKKEGGIDEFRLLGNLGISCAFAGDKPKAMRHLREALRLNPKYGLARANLEMVGSHTPEYLRLYGRLQAARWRRKVVQETPYPPEERVERMAGLAAQREFGWPIPEMEQILTSPNAFEAVEKTLRSGKIESLLPLIVILGQIKDPRGTSILGEAVLREENLLIAGAAAELLGEMGGGAVEALAGMLKGRPSSTRRCLIYGALGLTKSPNAYPLLVEALEDEDSEARTVAAHALAVFGNREAIPKIYHVYKNFRIPDPGPEDLEGAIGDLAYPDTDSKMSWKLRYRPSHRLGGPVPSIATVAALACEGRRLNLPGKLPPPRFSHSKKDMAEILEQAKEKRRGRSPEKRCPHCGQSPVDFYGLPLCSKASQPVKVFALEWIRARKAAFFDHLGDCCDALELDLMESKRALGWENLEDIEDAAARAAGLAPEGGDTEYPTGQEAPALINVVFLHMLEKGISGASEAESALR